jgi:hypothetical protein
VPEVWRYSGRLEIWLLDQGRYVRRQNSHALPVLSDKFIFELLSTRRTTKRPTWLRGVRNGIRARLG